MKTVPGEEEFDIRKTLHQINVNHITLGGQADFDALLQRIGSCSRRKDASIDQQIPQLKVKLDLTWLESCNLQQKSSQNRGDNETLNIELEISRNNLKEQRNEDLTGRYDTAEKTFDHKVVSNVDEEIRLGGPNSKDSSELGNIKNMTIYEELIRDLDVIASSQDNLFDDERMKEIEEFDNLLTKQLGEARKELRNQLLIGVGYNFLILNTKLKISNTKREIEREEELQLILSSCMKNESYVQSQQDDDVMSEKVSKSVDDNCFGVDLSIEKESEEGQEIARLKESILLADCLINLQKSELKASNELLHIICSKIKHKKAELDLLVKSNRVSADDVNCVGCRSNDFDQYNDSKNILPTQFSLDSARESGIGESYSVCYPRDGPSIEKSRLIQYEEKEECRHDKSESCYKEDRCGHFVKLEEESGPEKNITDTPPISPTSVPKFLFLSCDDYEDNLCEIWLERMSVASNLLKIPHEADEEDIEHVAFQANDAPRALGRLSRRKQKPRFKQTVYRTKAIPV